MKTIECYESKTAPKNRACSRFSKTGLILCIAFGFTARSSAAILCSGPEATVTLRAVNPIVSVLGTNTARLVFTLNFAVGDPTRLRYSISGTASNGVDIRTLPSLVTIPAGQTSAVVTVTPIANYPFETNKTLTVTITNSDNVCVRLGSPDTTTISLTGFKPPPLLARRSDSTNIVLAWSVPVTGFVLQAAETLPTAPWAAVTNPPVVVQGTNYLVTLANSGPARFYRLRKP